MQTSNKYPQLTDIENALELFNSFFKGNRSDYQVASWVKYKFDKSHDGFCIYNEYSNNFSYDELILINDFCKENFYTFSAIGRKSDNQSEYGSVQIEINICK